MNANHVRPLLAFWALALAAAVITASGLSASPVHVRVRPAGPSPVHGSGTPALVLGDVLQARPPLPTTSIARPHVDLTVSVEQAISRVPVPAPAPRPRSGSGGHGTPTTRPGTASTGSTQLAKTTVSVTPGTRHHGKGHLKQTATARKLNDGPGGRVLHHGRGHRH